MYIFICLNFGGLDNWGLLGKKLILKWLWLILESKYFIFRRWSSFNFDYCYFWGNFDISNLIALSSWIIDGLLKINDQFQKKRFSEVKVVADFVTQLSKTINLSVNDLSRKSFIFLFTFSRNLYNKTIIVWLNKHIQINLVCIKVSA